MDGFLVQADQGGALVKSAVCLVHSPRGVAGGSTTAGREASGPTSAGPGSDIGPAKAFSSWVAANVVGAAMVAKSPSPRGPKNNPIGP